MKLTDFHTRLADQMQSGSIFERAPSWLRENTSLNGVPYSFKDHEFQIDIASCKSQELVVKKCSQVGLTELAIRIMLALLNIKTGDTGIYVLPSAAFAAKFAKSRFDPVIRGSPLLSNRLMTANDSASMKIFGESILHINGASSQKQAISTPAQILFVDEYDFCNPTVLTTYSSRLRHAKDGGLRRNWSTPTISDFGVDKEYKTSSKGRYMVKCDHCGHWQAPDMMTALRVPGFDGQFSDYTPSAYYADQEAAKMAYTACTKCDKPLDAALRDPEAREWIHALPNAEKAGFWVVPCDLPLYNPAPSIVKQITQYDRMQDYYNFVLGEVYDTEETSIRTSSFLRIQADSDRGCNLGIDVGKTCHIVAGKKQGYEYPILGLYKTYENHFEKICGIIDEINPTTVVIDSGPDFTLCEMLMKKYDNLVFPSVYVENSERTPQYFTQNKTRGTVNVQRTKAFDSLAERVNRGRLSTAPSVHLRDFFDHMAGMKRQEVPGSGGERVARWVKTGVPDHFMHALLYCMIACDMTGDSLSDLSGMGHRLLQVSGTRFGRPSTGVSPFTSARELTTMFGVR